MDSRFPGWAARHALFAPWGILTTTYALTVYVKAVGWNIWNDRASLVTMSDMADLGLIVYACGASLVEVFIGMAFYALEQRKKRQELRRKEAARMREEAIREGLEEGLERGLEEGIERGLEKGIERGLEEGLEKGREEAMRTFSRNLILKANENPQASVEELVEAVASEMERAERN